MKKKRSASVFLVILLLIISIFLMVYINSQNQIIELLKQETAEYQNFIEILQGKTNDLMLEIQTFKDTQSVQTYVQSDNSNLLSALSTITNMNNFYPDFLPLQSEYAISQDYLPQHQSIDLSASRGTRVYAAGAGIVVACYEDKNLGNVILIDHLNSYKTLYAHLDQFRVSINTFLEKGQEIGTVGNTGNSTNPHLHFQIYYGNDPIDPNTMMSISKFKN